MKDKAARASLSAVIQRDLEALQKLDRELMALNVDTDGETNYKEKAAVGFILHNIYNALENSFEQISRTFENHIVLKSQWHRELMDKMFLEIPGIRPALFDENIKSFMNELRGFRHIFRHSYDYELNSESLSTLTKGWKQKKEIVYDSLRKFSDFLLSGKLI